MKERIFKLIHNQLPNCTKSINEDSIFFGDLELDKTDVFELIINVEKEFNISIDDEEVNKVSTVGDLIKLVDIKINGKEMKCEDEHAPNKSLFTNAINEHLKFDDTKKFALTMAENLPSYFYSVAASTSGKYHPKCDLGTGGLVRHSINVLTILNHMMEINQCSFTDREKELLRIAALFHDGLKCGTQDLPYEQAHTQFLHPVYSSNFNIEQSALNGFKYSEAKFIADAIISHMGQWNKSKGMVLRTPQTIYQKYLHLSDYLASRKDLIYDWK